MLCIKVALAAQFTVAEIIGDDDEDVGPALCGLGHNARQENNGEQTTMDRQLHWVREAAAHTAEWY